MSFVRAANRYGVSVLLHGSTTRQEFATRFRKADWLREEARHQLSAHESAHARERALALSA